RTFAWRLQRPLPYQLGYAPQRGVEPSCPPTANPAPPDVRSTDARMEKTANGIRRLRILEVRAALYSCVCGAGVLDGVHAGGGATGSAESTLARGMTSRR